MQTFFVPTNEIVCIENGENNTSFLIMFDGQQLKASKNVKQLEQKLWEEPFVRINRGCLINYHFLQSSKLIQGSKVAIVLKNARDKLLIAHI